ncbi:MAG TPA: DUF711 family protein, partial [Ktedonobacteraceae bacterium]|nr:DUF711 family protein [Ktedonobacteraceae bacterium]
MFIRTITLGVADPHPLSPEAIRRAAATLQLASARYTEAGYEVQTVRLSTRPIFDDLADWSPAALVDYAQELQRMLDDAGIGFCSLGPAQAARPDFPLERIELIADLLGPAGALNATVQLATAEDGLRAQAALPAARVMRRLAYETAEGFGNFRFAILACVGPGSPFFPSAYHAGPASLSLGLQGAGVVAGALEAYKNSGPIDLDRIAELVRAALIEQASPVVTLGQELASEYGLAFGGIDLSPAPMGDDSIVTAL